MAFERTRDQRMSATRLVEVGCAAVGGRVGGVSSVRANPVNRVPGNWVKGHSSLEYSVHVRNSRARFSGSSQLEQKTARLVQGDSYFCLINDLFDYYFSLYSTPGSKMKCWEGSASACRVPVRIAGQ